LEERYNQRFTEFEKNHFFIECSDN
jgi:hypothetical protein